MLPFLAANKKKMSTGLMISQRKPDEGKEPDEMQALEVAAKDLLAAVNANDIKAIAAAFKSAYQILESEEESQEPEQEQGIE